MSYIKNTLKRYSEVNRISKMKVIISSRGFHAICIYRLSNILYNKKIPILPMVLTRVIQVLYGIDIDYKSNIDEGLIIYHGYGTVIGGTAIIEKNVTIFHNVTLGISYGTNKGMPYIKEGTIIGAGATLLGGIKIGKECKVGANSLVVKSFEDEGISIGGNPARIINKNIK